MIVRKIVTTIGINNILRSFGIPLNIGDSHTFTTQEVINLGDPLRIYGAPNLAEVDFSQMSDRLAVMNIASVYDDSLKTKLTKLVVGSANKTNAELEEISGLKQAVSSKGRAAKFMEKYGTNK